MDIEVVGRHSLCFDDDAMAAFVNSSDALVEWNSLQIDRYDVRHLLSGPLPPRRPQYSKLSSHIADAALELELDHERYLDLHESSGKPEVEDDANPEDTGGYHTVSFSYGNATESADQKIADEGLEYSRYQPPFPVPESLVQCLPSTEKLHQIIARTAIFVSQHGGQSEIVLRVKQGDNPTFGFLMPDHHLHPYFRFLVDHPELLQSNVQEKTQFSDKRVETPSDSDTGGALTLLGSVYDSGVDEDGAEDAKSLASKKTDNATSHRDYHSSKKTTSKNVAEKGKVEVMSKLLATSQKEKASLPRRNPSFAASKTGHTSSMKKIDDSGLYLTSVKKSREPLVVEPPSDLKKLIDKIVVFIAKNGKQFEAALFEQDSEHLRFSFLLPSDQYHPYYLQVLQRAQESTGDTKNSLGNDDSGAGRGLDRRGPFQESGIMPSSGSISSDMAYEFDRKERFKMVIGKSKKDVQDLPSKATPPESGVTVDVAAAAAILKAATRGIKNPDLGILPIPDNIQKNNQDGGHSNLDPVGPTVPKNDASAANESDSSEAYLTKEQKLKVERLKRAKMFVAMLKSGNELPRSSSMESVQSRVGMRGSKVDHVVRDKGSSFASLDASILGENGKLGLIGKAREGSSVPTEGSVLDGSENFGRKYSVDEHMDRRSKRKYRSRSDRTEGDEENSKEEIEYSPYKRMRESLLQTEDGGVSCEVDSEDKLSKTKHRSSREHSCDEDNKKEKSHKRRQKKHRSHRHSHRDDSSGSDTEAGHHKHSKKKYSSHRSSCEDEEKEQYNSSKYHRHYSRRHSHEEDYGSSDTDISSDKRRSNKKHSSHRSSHEDDDDDKHDDYDKYHKHSEKKHRYDRSSRRSRESHKHRKSESSRDEEPCPSSKDDSSSGDAHKNHSRYEKERRGSHSEKEELEEGEISYKVFEQHPGSLISHETSKDNSNAYSLAPSQRSQSADVPDDLRAKIRAMLMATR